MNINPITRLREEENLTREDIAKVLDVTYISVSQWETSIPAKHALCLAAYCRELGRLDLESDFPVLARREDVGTRG
jgi:transcriptional regulator with XRE-family HTH domain